MHIGTILSPSILCLGNVLTHDTFTHIAWTGNLHFDNTYLEYRKCQEIYGNLIFPVFQKCQ